MIETELKVLVPNRDHFLSVIESRFIIDNVSVEKQLNHYFDCDGNIIKLCQHFNIEYIEGLKYSLRTRQIESAGNQKTILVVKFSFSDAHNGTSRVEVEKETNLTLSDLDDIISGFDFSYLSKWSRERTTFSCEDFTLCLDKNAGYGHLAEFEIVSKNQENISSVESYLKSLINSLGLVELDADRLNRMFKFYNKNWSTFYGTDNTFTIY